MNGKASQPLFPLGPLERRIYLIRGQKVMLDADLALLYGVTTFNLNKAVRRNSDRFPSDFMFRLTAQEYRSLRFQIGILKRGQHAKYLPHAFTEQGVAMLSGVLRSKRAVQVNIAIMRAFIYLRELALTHKDVALKLTELERRIKTHDADIRNIFDALREIMEPPAQNRRSIGFRPAGDENGPKARLRDGSSRRDLKLAGAAR